MVQLRLQRHGNIHRPFYHVVATDSRNPRDGKFIEKLGYYTPLTQPMTAELNSERMQYWYQMGAQVSPAVARLVKVKGIQLSRKPLQPAVP